jgi:hypothetical protein
MQDVAVVKAALFGGRQASPGHLRERRQSRQSLQPQASKIDPVRFHHKPPAPLMTVVRSDGGADPA